MRSTNKESTSLNKYISNTGACSRREADLWIEIGRIRINGRVATKGNRVKDDDIVTLDGKRIGRKKSSKKYIYLAVHKKPGITCTTDQSDPDNIIDYVNYPNRIFPIGRIDKASSGLVLMTDNGDIVNKILKAENKHEKEYIVTVHKPINADFINGMRVGVPILGRKTRRCKIKQVGTSTFKIILTEGMNRQIRRMCEYFGYRVYSLKRLRIMHIELDDLKVNMWRKLREDELVQLYKTLKM